MLISPCTNHGHNIINTLDALGGEETHHQHGQITGVGPVDQLNGCLNAVSLQCHVGVTGQGNH